MDLNYIPAFDFPLEIGLIFPLRAQIISEGFIHLWKIHFDICTCITAEKKFSKQDLTIHIIPCEKYFLDLFLISTKDYELKGTYVAKNCRSVY